MIFPDVDKKEWMEAHGFPVQKYDCPICQKSFDIDVPIIIGDSFGVSSPVHGCGEGMAAAILRPRTKKAIEFWHSVLDWSEE